MRRSIWFVLDRDGKERGEPASFAEQLVLVAEQLRLEDVSVTMVLAGSLPPDQENALRRLEVDVRTLDVRSSRAAVVLAVWLQEQRPDVVHFHFGDPDPGFVAAAKLSGATTVCHRVASLLPPRSFADALARRARGLLLDWLVDVRLEMSDLVAVSLGRSIAADGARVRREIGVGELPVIVSVPRFDDVTRGESLLRAVALLEPTVHVALVGEGQCELAWRALATGLGIDDRVHFLGLRQDLEDVLAAASVVVAPSEWDQPTGLAVIQGMAAYRPVIVARTGAMPAIVGDGGIVVPRSDPASLALAIRTVLSDPILAARLGALGRKRVEEEYSMDAYVERLTGTYRRILSCAEPRTEPPKMLELR